MSRLIRAPIGLDMVHIQSILSMDRMDWTGHVHSSVLTNTYANAKIVV